MEEEGEARGRGEGGGRRPLTARWAHGELSPCSQTETGSEGPGRDPQASLPPRLTKWKGRARRVRGAGRRRGLTTSYCSTWGRVALGATSAGEGGQQAHRAPSRPGGPFPACCAPAPPLGESPGSVGTADSEPWLPSPSGVLRERGRRTPALGGVGQTCAWQCTETPPSACPSRSPPGCLPDPGVTRMPPPPQNEDTHRPWAGGGVGDGGEGGGCGGGAGLPVQRLELTFLIPTNHMTASNRELAALFRRVRPAQI